MIDVNEARRRARDRGTEYLERKYSTQFEWMERAIEMGKYSCKITISPDDLDNLTTMLTQLGYKVTPGARQFYKCELEVSWEGD